MIRTVIGSDIPSMAMSDYFSKLVNKLFKILPMKESDDKTLPVYMRSLQREIVGCFDFAPSMKEDSRILSIESILEYLIDHPTCDVLDTRREIFKAISICNKVNADHFHSECWRDVK